MGGADAGTTTLVWGARTDVGLRRRSNQDNVLAAAPVFIVADGMGGHAAGDVASDLAVRAFRQLVGRADLALRDLVGAVHEANRAILADVAAHPARAGMGTTLSGFAVLNGRLGPYAAVVNVGDSRTYLLRGGKLQQLTTDHSLVQSLIEAGEIDEREAELHPQRHVVTRALGIESEVSVDATGLPLEVGDRLLVCSDGLSSPVPREALLTTLASSGDASAVADALVRLAHVHGAPDNVSVIVVDVQRADDSRRVDDDDDTLPGRG